MVLATKDAPVHVSVNSDSMKLQLVSREPESSDGSTVKGTNTGLTRALAIQPAFQKLNPNDRVELLSKLYDDEKSMTREFASLVTATLYSVQERVPTDVFCVSILSLKAYEPAPGERDRSLLDEHCREIKEAKLIAEIFKIQASAVRERHEQVEHARLLTWWHLIGCLGAKRSALFKQVRPSLLTQKSFAV